MFLDGVAPVDYRAPWDHSLSERVVGLRRRGARRRVVYFYEAPDTSTFRYRVFNMIEVLDSGEGDIAAAWFCEAEVDRLIALLPTVDVLVICRVRYSDSVNRLISRARSSGCDTVFDCDDLVFDPAYTHLILHTLDQRLYGAAWDHWYAYIGRIAATAQMCQRAIVTNDYLAEKMRAVQPGGTVAVIPNFLNRAQMALSKQIYLAKRSGGYRDDGRIHLGYFSGTPTHNKDFAVASAAVARMMAKDPRIVLRLVGFLEPGKSLAAFAERIERHPLQDFLNLQRLIGGTEFNLVPLQDNAFTNCKSELKYFEAAIVGTVTLASPTHAFLGAISDGQNGFLVNSTDWETQLGAAIAARGQYADMAEAAFQHATMNYAGGRMEGLVRAALFPT
jgi:glycosyltransferase involved in cell wall biosynthesis